MIYYKVKVSADQTIKNVKKYDVLVKNELYTERELRKFAPEWSVYVSTYFDKIEIPRKKTYWAFGARFANEETGFRY